MINTLIVIEGPTASGKTGLSVALAKALNCSVISADSRQFYKEMAIGTAKPSTQEMYGVKHFLVDSHTIHEEVTASVFADLVQQLLDHELKDENYAILTGGSGMFIDAFCIGLDPLPHDPDVRAHYTKRWETTGLTALLEELNEKDPVFFERVDQHNPVRIIRALEVIAISGKPISSQQIGKQKEHPFRIARVVLTHDREVLYARINERVDLMMQAGLLEEVRRLIPYRNLTPLQTVGYTELFAYFDGKCTLEEATEAIKQNSRRYAKRQLTWFRRHEDATWINYSTLENMIHTIKGLIS